ncbi:MAG: YkuS family protein [Firmicutes bacterium]|nr:YkuS family protein [Alicyclobacillaceae bacterium]MCL6497253.1 YkuS family protein [Bacillota bacterium]
MTKPIRVAVEGQLSPYAEALRQAGYDVVLWHGKMPQGVGAVVVQGSDAGFLGIEDAVTPAPVINAEGLTAEAVVEEVRRRALSPGTGR